MCILFVHTNPEPKENEYRLIVATNRDEYFKRPAKTAYQCPETGVIAGRDMEPGREFGTWLGFVTKKYPQNGKQPKHCFSCITNMPGTKVENPTGRGRLVIDYLESGKDYPEYVDDLRKSGLEFNGYNLMGVELSQDGSVVSYHHSNLPQIDSVYKGKHTLGFGNSPISTPLMKVVHGKEKFMDIINKGLEKDQLIDELVALLKDKTKYLPDNEIERRSSRGMDRLASVCVDFSEAGYGTRTHTIILIDKDWNFEFREITMVEPIDPENPKWNTTVIKSQL